VCHTVATRRDIRDKLLPQQTFTAAHLKELYQKHGAPLAAYACSFGLDFASAQDAVQQVFLRLLQGHATTPDLPLAYLYRAVRNAALNGLRDRASETPLPPGETWLAHPRAPIEEVLALQNALRALPDEQRETVFLRVWSGLTLQEIADATEVPLNTVASRYRYALEKLRGLLGKR